MKNMKLNKGEHCGQHSGDVAILAWQDKKRVTMISTYHNDDMHVAVNKANREETKPVVDCDYNINILGVDLNERNYEVASEIIQEASQCSNT
jgi:hypothetical protein